MKNKIVAAFLIIFSALFFIFAFLLNSRMISTRFLELSTLFFSINDEESGRDYLNLVATYGLHKKLYESVIDENNFSLEELKTSLILSENRKEFDKNINFLNFPALYIINGLRFLIGKPKIEKIIDSDFNDDLDLAYFFERQKQYRKSLALYDDILKEIKNDDKKKAIILLREGYCYSIMGEYVRAKEKYIEVININKNTSMAITALILLEYLEEFNKEIDKVKKNIDNPLEKGEKLFKLIAFKEAENILENLSKEGKNVNRDKVLFYLARCKESSGKTSEALKIFQEIIFDNPKSEYAKYSNRRMFVIMNNNYDEKIENLVKKNALLADDFDFSEFIDLKNNFETNINKNFPRKNEEKTDVEFIDDSIKKVQEKLDKIKIPEDKNEKPLKKYANQFVAKYDKTGKKIKESFYNEDGDLEYFEIYEYDKKNGLKRILHYDKDKNLLYYHSYKYNSKGEKTTIQTYDASGKILEFF